MKQKVFVVYDDKAQAYLQPFFLPNEALAKRLLADLANDDEHLFCKHARDYSCFELGEFDPKTGLFKGHAAFHLVCGLWELRRDAEVTPTVPSSAQVDFVGVDKE